MGIPGEHLNASIDELCRREAAFGAVLARHGYPEPRIRERGYVTLVRTIVGQQVSVKAAASMYAKLDSLVGATDPAAMAVATDERLREAGMSRQKAGYLRSLAELVLSGELERTEAGDAERGIALRRRMFGEEGQARLDRRFGQGGRHTQHRRGVGRRGQDTEYELGPARLDTAIDRGVGRRRGEQVRCLGHVTAAFTR